MNPNIPIPTDNIFKFYAMLGLVVMLTTAVMFFSRHEEYNHRAFERYVPMRLLELKPSLDEEEKARLFVFKEQFRIDKSNKKIELGVYILSFIFLGFLPTLYGFLRWHMVIQPQQDKILDLQITNMEAQIESQRNA